MFVCISSLYCLCIIDGISGYFLKSYEILNMIFGMRVLCVCMSISSFRMISVVEVKWSMSSCRLLCIIVCKLKDGQENLPVLFLKCKGSYEFLNDLNHGFRLSIRLRMFCSRHEKFYSQYLMQAFP